MEKEKKSKIELKNQRKSMEMKNNMNMRFQSVKN